jgi:hypothetical protein
MKSVELEEKLDAEKRIVNEQKNLIEVCTVCIHLLSI